jgi:hypothetical protein
MSMTRIGVIAAAALLAGGVGIATAQTTTTPSASVNQGTCWDSATNQVRDKTTTQMGSTTSGGMGSGMTRSSPMSPGADSPTSGSRPAEAAGLPDCR